MACLPIYTCQTSSQCPVLSVVGFRSDCDKLSGAMTSSDILMLCAISSLNSHIWFTESIVAPINVKMSNSKSISQGNSKFSHTQHVRLNISVPMFLSMY